MSYVIAWILVYGQCLSSKTEWNSPYTCTSFNHSNYKTEAECLEVLHEQNKYWKENKIKTDVYCIKSSIPLRLK